MRSTIFEETAAGLSVGDGECTHGRGELAYVADDDVADSEKHHNIIIRVLEVLQHELTSFEDDAAQIEDSEDDGRRSDGVGAEGRNERGETEVESQDGTHGLLQASAT